METNINVTVLQDAGTSLLSKSGAIPVSSSEGHYVSLTGLNFNGLGVSNSSSIVNLPILSEGSILGTGIGTQNLVLATAADGSRTFLIDASQLALLTQENTSFTEENSNSGLGSSLNNVVPVNLERVEPRVSILASQVPVTSSATNASNSLLKSNNFILPLLPPEDIQPPLKKGPFKCELCNKEFLKYKQYLRHQKLHLDDKPFRCKECDTSFNYESNLVLHAATHCKENPTCPECDKKFSRIASLKAHIMLHEKEENIVCLECSEEFSTQRHLDKHLKQHMEDDAVDKIYSCRHCNQKFSKPLALRDHMKIHVRLRASLHHRPHKKNIDRSSFPHKCEHCEKVFQKPSQLLRHKRIHTGERPYQCDMCDKAFNQKGALQIHKTKHSGEKPFICEFCAATFSQRGNLRNHIQRVHTLSLEPNQTRFQCVECSCVFRKIGNLNAHMSKMHSQYTPIWHKGTEPIGVQEEGQRVIKELMDLSRQANKYDKNKENDASTVTAENSDILQQALENSGLTSESKEKNQDKQKKQPEEGAVEIIKPPTSILKPKEGNQGETPSSPRVITSTAPMIMHIADMMGVMKRHIVRKVGGILWHQCVYCTKEFKKPSDLVRHIRIHTHERPYKCHLCYRAFAVTSTLKAHVKVHMGIKDFYCPLCKKFFSTQGSLKVHTRLHTGAKPFPCSQCDRQFRTSGHRKSHMLSHNKKTVVRSRRSKLLNQADKAKLSAIPLQEPILITEAGLVQPSPKVNDTSRQGEETDSTERPYQCPSCNRGFKKSSHLKQHIRSHTGEKPYKCLQCHRCFVSNGALKAHVQTHTGVKNFKCKICNTLFTTNGSLKRHMSTHSSERPYMCPYCQKTFKTAMDCKKHMKTHRPKLSFTSDNVSNIAIHPDNETENPGDFIEVSVLNDSTQSQDKNGEAIQETNVTSPKEHLVEISKIGEEGFEAIVDAENDMAQSSLVGAVGLSQESVTLNSQSFSHQQILTQSNLQSLQNSFEEQFRDNEEMVDAQFMSAFTVGNYTIQVPVSLVYSKTPFSRYITCGNCSKADSLDLNGLPIGSTFNINNPTLASANMESILPTKKPDKDLINNELEDVGMETREIGGEQVTIEYKAVKRSKKTYKCDYCGKFFKKHSHLKQHTRIHTGEKPYSCHLCGRQFNSTSVLNAHVKTHSGLKDHKCETCGSAFTTNKSLLRHMQIHSNESTYTCSICDESFRNKHSFHMHARTHHGDSEPDKNRKQGILQLSSEQAEEIAKLTLPESASVSEKVLIASAAEKDRISEMKDKYIELQKHPQFAHQCAHCPKSFKKPSDLVRHIRTHTGEKPYPCHLCNKSFTVKSTLDCHIKTHTGQKNFDCHVCNSFFATKGSLKVHMRLHTGSKPFKCPHCELRFRTSGHRKSHISTHFRNPMRRRTLPIRKQPIHELLIERSPSVPSKSNMGTTLFESSVEEDDIQGSLPGDSSKTTNISADHVIQSVDGIQLQIPSSLIGQNIQITGIDSGLFQLDSKFLQQLQGGNINITINPNIMTETNNEENEPSTNVENGNQFLQTLSGEPLLNLNSNSLVHQLNALGLSLDQAQLIANINDGSVQNSSGNVPFHITIDNNGKPLVEAMEVEESEVSLVNEDEGLDLDCEVNIGDGGLIDNILKDNRSRKESTGRYKCDTCGKCFQRRSLLERHERIHTGEKPFVCIECNKAFNQKNTLQIHMKKHTGEKPYICEFCEMAFTQKGNLKTHIRRVHPGSVEYRISYT